MDNDYYEFENRAYVEPKVALGEMTGFIPALRETMAKNTASVNSQTQNLGTKISTNLGGLTGADSYFERRYQSPRMESTANELKSAAQLQALNTLMSNYVAQAKKRYSDAYRNAVINAKNPSNSGDGDVVVDPETLGKAYSITGTDDLGGQDVSSAYPAGTTLARTITDGPYTYTYDQNGRVLATNNPVYARRNDGYYYDTTIKGNSATDYIPQIVNVGSKLASIQPPSSAFFGDAVNWLTKQAVGALMGGN